jgi:hypothetical protein
VHRLARFAPEELAGAALLLLILLFVAIHPGAITRQFASPYATPAPGGGPARQLVPESRPLPTSGAFLLFQRELARQ